MGRRNFLVRMSAYREGNGHNGNLLFTTYTL
jgi:hypothetical protein